MFKISKWILLSILFVSGIAGMFIPAAQQCSNYTSVNGPNSSGFSPIVIDGKIGANEWADASLKVPFWLDVNNANDSTGLHNVDTWNYMYLAENASHLNMALDLCGDQTWLPGYAQGATPEWVGTFFDTNASIPMGPWQTFGWANALDRHVASLIYDADYNETFPYFTNDTNTGVDAIVSKDNVTVANGTVQGDYSDLGFSHAALYNVSSVTVASKQQYRIDFAINMSNWFGPWMTVDSLRNVSVMINANMSSPVTSNQIVFAYANGTENVNDPHQRVGINTGTSMTVEYIPYGLGNATADPNRIMRFSLMGSSSSPFTMHIRELSFALSYNSTNSLSSVQLYGDYSSIKAYNVKYSFGPSVNNPAKHRQFEIAIPKSELPGLNDENFSLVIGGYGTMSFPNTNYWTYCWMNESGLGQFMNEYSQYYAPFNMNTSPPGNIKASWEKGHVTLNWSPPAKFGGMPVAGYNIYRGTSTGGESLLATVGNVTGWNDTSITNGQAYYYEISALNNTVHGVEGPRSAEASAIPGPPLTAPQNPTATGKVGQIDLVWSAPSDGGGLGVTGYNIYRGTSSGGESLQMTLGNLTTWNDTGVSNGQTYYYEISALRGTVEGPRSSEVHATPAVLPPATPGYPIGCIAGLLALACTILAFRTGKKFKQ
jgi:hypothetical protein